jgi:hypothetical protein
MGRSFLRGINVAKNEIDELRKQARNSERHFWLHNSGRTNGQYIRHN